MYLILHHLKCNKPTPGGRDQAQLRVITNLNPQKEHRIGDFYMDAGSAVDLQGDRAPHQFKFTAPTHVFLYEIDTGDDDHLGTVAIQASPGHKTHTFTGHPTKTPCNYVLKYEVRP